MAVTQLIYTSQPFGFDDAMLRGILSAARRNNPRSGITGALVCRHDIYLQLLEGEAAAVEELYARIVPDDRHLEPLCLWSGEVAARQFPAWAMRDDPARSWLWTPAEVAKGAARHASQDTVRAIFARVAAEVDVAPLVCAHGLIA